ncbi:MAG TPA: hypothetical protein VL326_07505 [Kofleriaceae bacterium]|jgi:hypothetical protein|nr:hypothetical protein [Kofleriaceae bacterium]
MPARTRVSQVIAERVLLNSAGTSTTCAGALAAATWLRSLGLTPPYSGTWRADLELNAGASTRFSIEIGHVEWGFLFAHAGLSSWIRVTSVPFVQDRDEYDLLEQTPPLQKLGVLIRRLERDYQFTFRRSNPSVQTDLPGLVPEAMRWLAQL